MWCCPWRLGDFTQVFSFWLCISQWKSNYVYSFSTDFAECQKVLLMSKIELDFFLMFCTLINRAISVSHFQLIFIKKIPCVSKLFYYTLTSRTVGTLAKFTPTLLFSTELYCETTIVMKKDKYTKKCRPFTLQCVFKFLIFWFLWFATYCKKYYVKSPCNIYCRFDI